MAATAPRKRRRRKGVRKRRRRRRRKVRPKGGTGPAPSAATAATASTAGAAPAARAPRGTPGTPVPPARAVSSVTSVPSCATPPAGRAASWTNSRERCCSHSPNSSSPPKLEGILGGGRGLKTPPTPSPTLAPPPQIILGVGGVEIKSLKGRTFHQVRDPAGGGK
nr:classical arabinogalactan protein 7-like [Taeniopygia guttata]